MVTAAEKFIFSGKSEPYLTMITEYEGTATTFSYGANVQPGDLVIVCARGVSSSTTGYPGHTLTPTNATLAVSKTHNFTTTQTSGGTDTQTTTTYYNTAVAAVYYRIAQSETSIVITGAGDVSGYVIRNANRPLYSASVFDTNTDTDGDVTISTATNKPGTVRAVAIFATNTAKYVLNSVNIGTVRTYNRNTALGYETTVAERIFGANDNDSLQDCCSIDPQSGTGSLRLDSEGFNASAAAVLTVN